ncbi:MAG: hypothetical protein AAGG09_08050 [Pseudomonadota bacterium]
MLISISHRFIFVANSKSASSSVETALRPFCEIERGGAPNRKHIGMPGILNVYDFLFREERLARHTFFAFGVMREPLDWIGSWYRYRAGNRKLPTALPAGMTFAEFWERQDWTFRDRAGQKNLQSRRFLGADGEPLVDMIVPYDRVAEDLSKIADAMDLDLKLPRRNRSRITERPSLIPDFLESDLRAHFAEDYALYDRLDAVNRTAWERLQETRAYAEAF